MKETDLLPTEKKYIEIQYDPVTQGYLREFCYQNGFDLGIRFDGGSQDPEEFDFHSTVWFTTTEHQIENTTHSINVEVKPIGWALFGPQENILVMEIESQELEEIREHYKQEYDMQDSWPDYRPHITVCYNHKTGIPDFEPQDQIDFPLVADCLNIKKQKD